MKNKHRRLAGTLGSLLALTLVLSACSSTKAPTTQAPANQTPASAQATDKAAYEKLNATAGNNLPADFVGKLTVEPKHALPGGTVTVTGTGLPANTNMDLVWGTFKGAWDIRGAENEEYHGRGYTPVNQTLSSVTTDASGNLKATFTVPDGVGDHHDVMVVQNGTIRNKADFVVDWTATISPKSGPVGTPITIDFKGQGADVYSSIWQVLYDNSDIGFLSSVTTNGEAKATITATGTPGKHFITIQIGSFQTAYLNVQESPKADLPPMTFEFDITDGAAVMPPAFDQQTLPTQPGKEPDGNGPTIWTSTASGPINTPTELKGKGLPVNAELNITWEHQVGSRVTNKLWDKKVQDIGKVTTDAQGNFTWPFKAFDDLGGMHTIAVQQNGKDLATGLFTITASPVSISPASGPAGTTATILLKGVGWTETANIYTVLYDNKQVGYVCGFSTQGTVHLPLTMTGEPGVHYIDLYPGIYKGEEPTGASTFREPMLNVVDHPSEKIPALHFAFTVTGNK